MPSNILYLYQDRNGHRIVRKNQKEMDCHECALPMLLIAAIPKEEGESKEKWGIRALARRRGR